MSIGVDLTQSSELRRIFEGNYKTTGLISDEFSVICDFRFPFSLHASVGFHTFSSPFASQISICHHENLSLERNASPQSQDNF
jgi:hypothetical protein